MQWNLTKVVATGYLKFITCRYITLKWKRSAASSSLLFLPSSETDLSIPKPHSCLSCSGNSRSKRGLGTITRTGQTSRHLWASPVAPPLLPSLSPLNPTYIINFQLINFIILLSAPVLRLPANQLLISRNHYYSSSSSALLLCCLQCLPTENLNSTGSFSNRTTNGCSSCSWRWSLILPFFKWTGLN